MNSPPPVSTRMLRVQSPMIPVVGEMIKRHPGTISLGQGVVHYGPPASVGQAAARAAAEDPKVHRYALAFGIDSLLDAIRTKLESENATTIGPDRRIVVTAGSNMAFLTAILAIADVGDEIILLSPYYFNHEMAVDIAGCRVVGVATDADYQPRINAIDAAITPRTRAVVTVTPNNPTGAVYSAETLRSINALCRDHGIFHLADEPYEYFTYGGTPHFSPTSLPISEGHTISMYTLSKAYGMAGWRVGYMVIPAHLEEAVKKIQDTNLICPPIVNQIAAVDALKAGRTWCRSEIEPFTKVRENVLDELSKLGDRVHAPEPGGAFYSLVRVNTFKSDMQLVEPLIREFGVAVMPGSTFGIREGCYLRIAYGALDQHTVEEGMGRLVKGLGSLV